MVTAVWGVRGGCSLGGNVVVLTVDGGLRVSEPAADLAVAAALVSSLSGVPVPKGSVVFGEIGLAAEVRAVAHADPRLKEAAKLGFGKALLPRSEEHTSELQSLMRISYAVFCLKKKKQTNYEITKHRKTPQHKYKHPS